jgi:hypothetical protein
LKEIAMSKKTMNHARARASARGDAIATLLFGAVLLIASVIITLAETDVPKYLIGFGTFLAGVALSAWGSSELERLAAPRRNPNRSPQPGDATGWSSTSVPETSLARVADAFRKGSAPSRSAHFSSPVAPPHLQHAGE